MLLCQNTARITTLTCLLATALLAPLAQSQEIYRIVGADGKVTFSDQPPPDAKNTAKIGTVGAVPTETRQNLPFELQQRAVKYPITLYSAQNCPPCDSGRNLLTTRGIPHTEKTVNTSEDVAAFGRVSTENTLPLLVVGGLQIKGFSAAEWGQHLDAAGYPKKSTLPPGYKHPMAQALAPLKTTMPTPVAISSPSIDSTAPVVNETQKPISPTVNTANPAGIKF